MRLTDLKIRTLQTPEHGQKTWWDELPGFGVRVYAGGSKSYILMCGPARTLMTIGRVGIINLSDARKRARELLAERTLGKTRAVSHMHFGEALELFLETHDAKASTRTKYRAVISRHFLAKFRHEPLERIRTADLMRILDRLRDRPAEASLAYGSVSVLFKWALARRLIDRSPLEGVPRPYQGDPRERVLTDDEIRAVFAIQDPSPLCLIVRLALLTGQRRGQLAALRREWIDHDVIRFPATVMKMGKAHQIPFGHMAADILEPLPADGLLFPNRKNEPYSSWPAGKRTLDLISATRGYTIHDCRRTFATMLAEVADPIIVERFLAHSRMLSGVAGIYNRFNYLPQMREAIKRYEIKLQALLSNTESANGSNITGRNLERSRAA